MIRVDGLRKIYQAKSVLDGISFEVPSGSIFALLGANGAGKSTIVKILSTCLSFDAGRVEVAGFDVTQRPKEVRRSIAVSGQFTSLDDQLTGRENLHMFARLIGVGKMYARELVSAQLDKFGLHGAGDERVSTYSGGMKRRLDLAVALISPPKVLFLDEPTTGLDPKSRADLWGMIKKLKTEQNVTVVLTTQYLEEADQLSDQVVLIDEGRIKAQGSPDELKQRYGQLSCTVQPLNIGQLDALSHMLQPFGEVRIDQAKAVAVVILKQGMESIVGIVRRIDQAGIEVADISVFRPSLDDVFHTLTGGRERSSTGDLHGSVERHKTPENKVHRPVPVEVDP